MIDDLIDIVRRQAIDAVASREGKGTLLCTAYNPKTHAIKGILMPQEVETGWVPISAAHTGNGYGILVGPKVGDPQKAADGFDGDVFDVEFANGDANTPVAKLKQFSAEDKPPEVQSGEVLIRHSEGTKTFINKDGELTHQFKDDGGKMTWTKDKKITIDNSGQRIVVKGQNIDFNPDS